MSNHPQILPSYPNPNRTGKGDPNPCSQPQMLGDQWCELQRLPTTCLCSANLKKINWHYWVNLVLVKAWQTPCDRQDRNTHLQGQNSIYVKHHKDRGFYPDSRVTALSGQDGRSVTFLEGSNIFIRHLKYREMSWLWVAHVCNKAGEEKLRDFVQKSNSTLLAPTLKKLQPQFSFR